MKVRLDTLLVDRALVESREKARALVLAGKVTVNGRVESKAGAMVGDDADVVLASPEHPWVGRGGVKLAHALEVFRVDPAGRVAIDIGASTGGFTDVLLARGATRVIAVDVGRGQLHWRLRTDPRVTLLEGLNARALHRRDLPDLGVGAAIVTIDVSFISLKLIVPAVPALLAADADVIALVKPQFEAGRHDVGAKGLVTDPAIHTRVLHEVTKAAATVGLRRDGLVDSPITGAEGNREFLMLLRPHGY
ncbi:MAG: TlyA family RNA methyltransferase [Vicinamibacterales bacterium]